MRRAAGIVVVLAVLLTSPAGAIAQRRTGAMQQLQTGVLTELNTIRHEHGLVPLRPSSSLSAAARQHSVEMALRGYFSHTSANGTTFDKRIARFYPMGRYGFWSVGENLLWSSPDVDPVGALRMWMNSPEHKANILNAKWRQIGVSAVHVDSAPGVYGGAPITVITTDFGVRR
jgi:uncharacterized protein YkwD